MVVPSSLRPLPSFFNFLTGVTIGDRLVEEAAA